jgi:hypothetical protein
MNEKKVKISEVPQLENKKGVLTVKKDDLPAEDLFEAELVSYLMSFGTGIKTPIRKSRLNSILEKYGLELGRNLDLDWGSNRVYLEEVPSEPRAEKLYWIIRKIAIPESQAEVLGAIQNVFGIQYYGEHGRDFGDEEPDFQQFEKKETDDNYPSSFYNCDFGFVVEQRQFSLEIIAIKLDVRKLAVEVPSGQKLYQKDEQYFLVPDLRDLKNLEYLEIVSDYEISKSQSYYSAQLVEINLTKLPKSVYKLKLYDINIHNFSEEEPRATEDNLIKKLKKQNIINRRIIKVPIPKIEFDPSSAQYFTNKDRGVLYFSFVDEESYESRNEIFFIHYWKVRDPRGKITIKGEKFREDDRRYSFDLILNKDEIKKHSNRQKIDYIPNKLLEPFERNFGNYYTRHYLEKSDNTKFSFEGLKWIETIKTKGDQWNYAFFFVTLELYGFKFIVKIKSGR